MSYGTIKVDTITFTDNGSDVSVSVSGLAKNPTFSGDLTVTGTISGTVIQGGTTVSGVTVTGTTANFVSGVYTTQISGATITGDAGQFTTLTGGTAGFTTVTGTTVTGTTANFVSGVFTTQVSGATITGDAGEFTTLTGGTAGFTTITGTTVTGTTANFVTVSGTTVTGNAGNFTTATVTSGVFASGTEAAPSVSVGTTDNGLYSPGTDQVAISTNGTGRLFVDSAGRVGLGGASSPVDDLHISTSNPSIVLEESDAGTDEKYWRTRVDNGAFIFEGLTDAFGSPSFWLRAFRATNSEQVDNIQFATSGSERLRITPDGTLMHLGAGNSTSPAVQFNGSAPANSMVMLSDGKVGIGTASPGASLHVAGTGAIIRVSDGERIDLIPGANANDPSLIVSSSGSALTFASNGASEMARLDTSGRLLVGTSTARTDFKFETSSIEPLSQIESTGSSTALSITRNSDSRNAGTIYLGKSRGDTLGSSTVVQDSDRLGSISFNGADGDRLIQAVRIDTEVDGTPGSNNMPGRLVFSVTADGSATPTEAMRIKNSGIINIANTPVYADNAAAKTGGLVDGDVYRTSTGDLKIVYT